MPWAERAHSTRQGHRPAKSGDSDKLRWAFAIGVVTVLPQGNPERGPRKRSVLWQSGCGKTDVLPNPVRGVRAAMPVQRVWAGELAAGDSSHRGCGRPQGSVNQKRTAKSSTCKKAGNEPLASQFFEGRVKTANRPSASVPRASVFVGGNQQTLSAGKWGQTGVWFSGGGLRRVTPG